MTDTRNRKRIVVVGGVAGGATCATRCRRLDENADILVLERGRHISFANCGLPYHVGGIIEDREKLTGRGADFFRERYNIEVRSQSEVTSIDRDAKAVTILNRATGESYQAPYDTLILSPGAEPIRPPLPGIDDPRVLTLRNVKDMDAMKAAADGAESAIVVGAGFIGLEMVENLVHRGIKVTLVEKLEQVFPPMDREMAAPLATHILGKGVNLILGDGVAGFADRDGKLEVQLESGRTATGDFAVLAIGVRPETKLAADAGLEVGDARGIVVNQHMQTSDPSIYALGDAVQLPHIVTGRPVHIPLAGPAHKQARAAANHINGQPDDAYAGVQGTSVVGLFELTAAVTGANERALQAADLRYEKIYIHAANHAGYYPGASQLHIKLLFDPENGRVLGAQIYGQEGVDKRIDVLAVAVRHKLTVFDLFDMELAYAPQYGNAKDPVNIAGAVAMNVIRGQSDVSHFQDLGDDAFLLDVRTPAEVAVGCMPGAVNIPVDDLRQRLSELPDDRAVHVYCGVGQRAWLAERIVKSSGKQASNLSGGWTSYCCLRDADRDDGPDGGGGNGGGRPAPTAPKTESSAAEAPAQPSGGPAASAKQIDARGLQCPGPIVQLAQSVAALSPGEQVRILASDPGFATDVGAWANQTGNRLVSVDRENGTVTAVVEKGSPEASPAGEKAGNGFTAVVFSGQMDRALAALVLANGAAAAGMKTSLFFTFWGLSALRKPKTAKGEKRSLLDRMFAWMLPAGVRKLKLSQWQFAGAGRWLMNRRMKDKNVDDLPTMLQQARDAGVQLVACQMSLDMLGLRKADLIDGVELGGVATFMNAAAAGRVSMFI